MKKEKDQCSNCEFLRQRIYNNKDVGYECRYNPPIDCYWPLVKLTDWCGKYQYCEYPKDR